MATDSESSVKFQFKTPDPDLIENQYLKVFGLIISSLKGGLADENGGQSFTKSYIKLGVWL